MTSATPAADTSAPNKTHTALSVDYRDMMYADTPAEVERQRRVFLRKWAAECLAVAKSLREAGEEMFTFTRLPPSQWKSARTMNGVEREHAEFKRRIKTQTVLPQAETAPMLFWALLHPGRSRCARSMAGKA